MILHWISYSDPQRWCLTRLVPYVGYRTEARAIKARIRKNPLWWIEA